jgi:hypothetical protein
VKAPLLSPSDLEMFNRFGVSAELLAESYVKRVSDLEARELLSANGRKGDLSGIVFEYFSPVTGHPVTCRVRVDNPVIKDGKPEFKYLSAYGDRKFLYFPPGSHEALEDKTTPVVLVESEKAALALTAYFARNSKKLFAVGLGGCWGWTGVTGKQETSDGKGTIEKGPIADLFLCAYGRPAYVLFDSNCATNPKVKTARNALVKALKKVVKSSEVKILDLPAIENVNGPDDYIREHGDDAMTEIFNTPVLEGKQRKQAEEAARQQAQAHEQAARVEKLRKLAIDPGELIADLERYFDARAFLPDGAGLVLGYWALHTWVFPLFHTVPYLSVESATPECGKSHVLNLLKKVCCRAELLVAATPAILFRLVDALKPTLLLDEVEILKINNDIGQTLLAVAHEGYKRGAVVYRCIPPDFQPTPFEVFCPKVFSGIGGIAHLQALLSRSIVLHIDKKPNDVQLTRCRERILERDSAPLRESMEAYALQFAGQLQALYDEAEIWGPLLTHAKLLGANFENRLYAVMKVFAYVKSAIQRDESAVAKTVAVLDVLKARAAITKQAFTPGIPATFYPSDLIDDLAENEDWSCTFGNLKTSNDEQNRRRVWGQSVGYFLRRYRLQALKRDMRGKKYDLMEAIDILSLHVPKDEGAA